MKAIFRTLLVLSVFLGGLSGTSGAKAESLWRAEDPQIEEAPTAPVEPKSKTPPPLPARTIHNTSSGNLSHELKSRSYVRLEQTSIQVVRPDQNLKSSLRGLKAGDVVTAKIPHSVIAFPDEKAPVLALVEGLDVPEGVRLVGESRLERNSKRIFIDFYQAALDGKPFRLKGVALTSRGVPGFEGEYHSREAAYFAGDFISSFVAAYFDAQVPRKTNVFGQDIPDSSVDAALKKGASAGAMSSAERFREKLKKVPEFSELKGPTEIRVIVIEAAAG